MTTEHPLEGSPLLEPVLVDEPPLSRWPVVIGVLSLIYALGGLLCAVGIGASSFFMEAMMAMAGLKVETPLVIKINGMISAVLLLIAGIVMLTGAIGTLRRKRSGPGTLRVWAVMRLSIALLGAIMTVVLAPANIQFQRSMLESQQQRLRDAGRADLVQEVTDDQIWRNTMIQVGIFSALLSAYPLFIGFYLARRKIMTEVSEWP